MRAVTWTQVAQYIILIIAYLTPVVWLGVKHTGIPIPQLAYGQVLQKVTELEKKFTADPKEMEVRGARQGRGCRGRRGAEGPRQGDRRAPQGDARAEAREGRRPTTRRTTS